MPTLLLLYILPHNFAPAAHHFRGQHDLIPTKAYINVYHSMKRSILFKSQQIEVVHCVDLLGYP
jgi:hypothetical protein